MNKALAIVFFAFAVAPGVALAQGPPANVRVNEAREERLVVPRSVTGEIVSLRRSLIASQVEGFVLELGVNEGDAVERGAPIARLDDTLAGLDVAQAQADLESARGIVAQREAELERFQRDFARVKTLFERGSTTESGYDAAEVQVRTTAALLVQARASVLASEAALDRARKRLADKTITAPFTGRVITKRTEVGEWVAPGDPVVEIVSLDEIEARIDVPEHLVGYLTEDIGSIPLRIPGLGTVPDTGANLIGIIPDADRLSRMFRVRLAVPNESRILKPGMSLTAFVPTGVVEPVLTIHKDAILRDDAGEFVYLAIPHSIEANPAVSAQAIPARISRRFAWGDRVAIRPGQVAAGSMLLVEGNERVFPSQLLAVQDPPPGSPFDKATRGAREDKDGAD